MPYMHTLSVSIAIFGKGPAEFILHHAMMWEVQAAAILDQHRSWLAVMQSRE